MNLNQTEKQGWVGVFCGASEDVSPEFFELATEVGTLLGNMGLGLVYGGGRCGMMGKLADAALEAGAEVCGVIPRALLVREVAYTEVTELIVSENLFDRKQLLIEKSDMFLILPGGLGTLDEFFEVITHSNLGYHSKPTVIFDYKGFYSQMINWLHQVGDWGFIKRPTEQFVIARNIEDIKVFLS